MWGTSWPLSVHTHRHCILRVPELTDIRTFVPFVIKEEERVCFVIYTSLWFVNYFMLLVRENAFILYEDKAKVNYFMKNTIKEIVFDKYILL